MKRALISVYDKTGIIEFAKKLAENNYEIISTSGTAKLLRDSGIPIKTIEEITGSGEILEGRVKTLHPLIFGGILADRKIKSHLDQLIEKNIKPIDLVVVNLYPFEETIRKEGCTEDEAIEQIDIGGVSLIRAAAKNFKNTSVLVSPSQYNDFLNNPSDDKYSLKLAEKAFRYIAEYDKRIASYFSKLTGTKDNTLVLEYSRSIPLRYGENPHQSGELYLNNNRAFDEIFNTFHGKELSYNNILDIDAAYNLIIEFDEAVCAIFKHCNPCGIACDEVQPDAFRKALETDSLSAFGGIIIFNRKLGLEAAAELDKVFSEIIIAPEFGNDTLELLKKKKNRRLITYNNIKLSSEMICRSVTGGLLSQSMDISKEQKTDMKTVTKRAPTDKEWNDLLFAMKAAKHTKSNSIVYARDKRTLGIGAGQPSRVDSSRTAIEKAKRAGLSLEGSSVASEAFFPFSDGVIEAAKAGAKSVIQPGGSVRDDEVIKAADEYGLAMIFTGVRHFKH